MESDDETTENKGGRCDKSEEDEETETERKI